MYFKVMESIRWYEGNIAKESAKKIKLEKRIQEREARSELSKAA